MADERLNSSAGRKIFAMMGEEDRDPKTRGPIAREVFAANKECVAATYKSPRILNESFIIGGDLLIV